MPDSGYHQRRASHHRKRGGDFQQAQIIPGAYSVSRHIHQTHGKHGLGSHKDRHEKIGEGQIGLETFVKIVTHPKLRELPFYLETPNDLDGYQREIALLRERAEIEKT